MLTLIAARDKNGAIGKDNTIPWHAPEDLKAFQRETLGGAIIMGRNTWESLPVKPLKNRLNIVVSSDPTCADLVCATLEDALEAARSQGYFRIYAIGGAGIYRACLPIADRLMITEVKIEVEHPDTFFPDFSEDNWSIMNTLTLRKDAPQCELIEYKRIVQ
ncbi:dihydrofolate reductase [Epibacterium ulvae]|uniref:dihydrofolate reductase n=1 Tax=Epibacterium ulvae TaxID=1156985 RepID=UPI0024921E9F|nr:dihydrofolate reductase [Epibacterium ulvae]